MLPTNRTNAVMMTRMPLVSVPRYSWMFFGGSIALFLLHLPFLDKAERKRKEILTGGNAPPWYGPA